MKAGVATTWGSTGAERAETFPCDELVDDPDVTCWRAVDVDSPPAVVFRWLCQLRAAPYSYDWIDNRGGRSPRRLTPGLDQLEVGQAFMTIFWLVSFEPDRHITLVSTTRAFGEVAVTYRIGGRGDGARLVAKLLARSPGSPGGLLRAVRSRLLPFGDVIMMRKQLLTLKRLAETAT